MDKNNDNFNFKKIKNNTFFRKKMLYNSSVKIKKLTDWWIK